MQCSSTCNNCEADNDEYIIDALKDVEVQKTTELEEVAYEKQPETTEFNSTLNSPSFISISPPIPQATTLETCSITYFSGYLVKKMFGEI